MWIKSFLKLALSTHKFLHQPKKLSHCWRSWKSHQPRRKCEIRSFFPLLARLSSHVIIVFKGNFLSDFPREKIFWMKIAQHIFWLQRQKKRKRNWERRCFQRIFPFPKCTHLFLSLLFALVIKWFDCLTSDVTDDGDVHQSSDVSYCFFVSLNNGSLSDINKTRESQ